MCRKMTFLLAVFVGLLSTVVARADTTPDQALSLLLNGNRHFVDGDFKHLDKMSSPAVRQKLASEQKPYAVVLTCSDSRLSPEILFDKGLGEIFAVRVAGNVVSPHELGSIEYAVEHLGASLIMVLGHERCGAVTATYDAHIAGALPGGNIGSLIQSIDPAVGEILAHNPAGSREEIVEACIIENIHNVAIALEEESSIIKEAIEQGKVRVVAARYDLDDGIVTLLEQRRDEFSVTQHEHNLTAETAMTVLTISITTKPLTKPLSPAAAKFNLSTIVPTGTTAEDLQGIVTNLPNWITLFELPKVSKTKGTIALQIAANSSYAERQATISVGANNYEIKQAGLPCPAPLLSQAAVTLPATGGVSTNIAVTLPEGCGWTVTVPTASYWLSATPVSGSGAGSFSLNAVANNTTKDLQTKVTVLTKNGKKGLLSAVQSNLISQYAGNYSGTFSVAYQGTFTATFSKTGEGKGYFTNSFGNEMRSQIGKVDSSGVIWAETDKCGQITIAPDGKAYITFYLYVDSGYIKAEGNRI